MLALWKRCLITFVLSLLSDVVAAIHLRTLVHDRMTLAVLSIAVLQYVNLFAWAFFADDKSWWARLWLTTATASASGLGTFLVITWSF